MYKKVLIVISIFTMCATSYALGYATGGSNMGYYYPSFSSYISYDPTYEELGRYVDEGKEYVDNCNNDSRTKNGFPFCGDGFVIDTIPIFYSIIKSRRHTANMTTGTGTIKGILPAVVTTLPQAGYVYSIA